MTKTVFISKAKRRLALVWLIGIALPGALLFVQSMMGFYGDDGAEVGRWFIAAVSPTGGLILAVLVADAGGPTPPDRRVGALIFQIALGVSLLYLAALWLLILYARAADGGVLALTREMGMWLTALQGAVTLVLGVFFVRRKEA